VSAPARTGAPAQLGLAHALKVSSAVIARLQNNIAGPVTPAAAGIPNGAVHAYHQEPFAIAAPTMTEAAAMIAAAVAMSQFRTGVKSPRYISPAFRQGSG
jgi:hypothetical protein